MSAKLFLVIAIFFLGCKSSTKKDDHSKADQIGSQDSSFSNNTVGEEIKHESVATHFKDTLLVSGNYVVFLRPDSARFESYANEDENVYDADSDFGFAISATTDSIFRNKKYSAIHTAVSEKRFIVLNSYTSIPTIIDRDSINYGLILTSKTKESKIITNLHSGDYLEDIDEYFNFH
jgi:hypothetical protein